ncbi:hypothetical protein [Spongiactinospora sp. TRM90649]|uniref:hypothetical protein n=1 Tax=Spongiactinospora sp. TRM90649 TaxID=3031114 RepID=UPI0023F76C28|nr:hypothetical protein [Spongiactinospora sp. TRM90649]MDF5752748.1 hypothetical protein [Spongiactinospora sp. TRM90649]
MSIFVGRTAEVDGTLQLLGSLSGGVVLDVVGVHGSGKTMFMDRVSELAGADPGTQVYLFDMARYDLGAGFHDDYGATASAAVLWETFTRSRAMMRFLADPPVPEFDRFKEVCRFQSRLAEDFLAKNEISLGRRSAIEKAEFTSIVHIGDEAVRQRIREAQSEIDDAFAEAWEEYTLRRRVLITVDTFELVADDELGHWMVRMAMRMAKTLVILARVPAQVALSVPSPRYRRLDLANLGPTDVQDYLSRRLHPDPVQPALAEVVYGYTDGHAGGVALIGDLVVESGGHAVDPRSLRRTLERLPEETSRRWAELVLLIIAAVHEPHLRQVLDAIAITRTFDATLLSALVRAMGDEESDVGDAIAKLVSLRLLQDVPTPDFGPSGRFRIHEFIRLSLASRLQTYHPDRWRNLHRAAAEYFFERLRRWEDGIYTTYTSWYRFEDREWQEDKREWLRHSGLLTGDHAISRARFTLVFLEAFWWWGYYIPFPLNRRLLEDWSRTSAAWEWAHASWPESPRDAPSPDEQLLDALTYLLDNYPLTHVKPPGAPWDGIRSRLLLIRRICGIEQRSAAHSLSAREKEDVKRTNAFITLFLAHTRRYRDPADQRADAYYDQATAALEELGDAWTVAWIHFERADHALERGLTDHAVAVLSEAARRTRDLALETPESDGGPDWDHELIANLHRVRADLHWAAGERGPAADQYGRALAHAYVFQGEPNPPDEYSRQFYLEIGTRTAARMTALGEDEAMAFLAALRRHAPAPPATPAPPLFVPDLTLIRERFLARGPMPDELGSDATEFFDEWSDFKESMAPDASAGMDTLI